jgi:hypothetical protein
MAPNQQPKPWVWKFALVAGGWFLLLAGLHARAWVTEGPANQNAILTLGYSVLGIGWLIVAYVTRKRSRDQESSR